MRQESNTITPILSTPMHACQGEKGIQVPTWWNSPKKVIKSYMSNFARLI
jgi:hypothetical protein